MCYIMLCWVSLLSSAYIYHDNFFHKQGKAGSVQKKLMEICLQLIIYNLVGHFPIVQMTDSCRFAVIINQIPPSLFIF